MKKTLCLSAALLLMLTATQGSLAQGRGNGNGNGKGGDNARDRGEDHGKRDQDSPGKGAGPKDDKGKKDRHDDPSERDRAEDRRDDRSGPVVIIRSDQPRGLIAGCPPGLAKRNNGCLPPGQERKLARARNYDGLWGRPATGAARTYTQRYDSGYIYRYDQQGGLMGYLPALGGLLSAGNLWPRQYSYNPAPRYQTDYYGLNQSYDYRYADGAIYGVNRNTSSIEQISALLTGQSPSVGQKMPAGYDAYNVPYAYRGQYADTPQSAYRYNDGAVYQLDPKTQLIQAIIKLLT